MADVDQFATLDKWGRTSPFGMLRFAHEYLVAAQTLHQHMTPSEFSIPKYTNVGLAIELAMKAFLLAGGESLTGLKAFGHDLEKLFNACMERGIDQHVDCPGLYRDTIVQMNVPYKAQVLRYIVNGTMMLPQWQWLDLAATRLTEELKTFCLAATLGEEEAARAIAVRGGRW